MRFGENHLTNEETIERLLRYQECHWVHPLTCNEDNCYCDLIPEIINDIVLLVCPACGYQQSTYPEVCLNVDLTDEKNDPIKMFKDYQYELESNSFDIMFKLFGNNVKATFDLKDVETKSRSRVKEWAENLFKSQAPYPKEQ